jgi:hypothetical protein
MLGNPIVLGDVVSISKAVIAACDVDLFGWCCEYELCQRIRTMLGMKRRSVERGERIRLNNPARAREFVFL